MSVKIRLARGGAKKRPFYRIVAADSRAPRDGRFIEKLGTYNPNLPKDGERVSMDAERVTHWLMQGAVPSERVAIFLQKAGVGQDFKQVKQINKKRDNVIELKKAEIEAKKKAEAEAKAAEEAKKKAEEEQAAKEAAEAEAAAAAEAAEAEAPAEEAAAE